VTPSSKCHHWGNLFTEKTRKRMNRNIVIWETSLPRPRGRMMQNKEKEASEKGRWATAAAAGPGDVVRKANAQGRINRRMSGAVGNGAMECGKQRQGCT